MDSVRTLAEELVTQHAREVSELNEVIRQLQEQIRHLQEENSKLAAGSTQTFDKQANSCSSSISNTTINSSSMISQPGDAVADSFVDVVPGMVPNTDEGKPARPPSLPSKGVPVPCGEPNTATQSQQPQEATEDPWPESGMQLRRSRSRYLITRYTASLSTILSNPDRNHEIPDVTKDPAALTEDDPKLRPPSYCKLATYFGRGMFNNRGHKQRVLEVRSELAGLRTKLNNHSAFLWKHELLGKEESNENHDDSVLFINKVLCRLNGVVQRYHEDLSMSHCPVQQTLKEYIEERDKVMKIICPEDGWVPRKKRIGALNDALGLVYKYDAMGAFVDMQLANTDQLLFKFFLFCINLLTFFSKYILPAVGFQEGTSQ